MPQGGTAVNGTSLIYLSEISRFLCLDVPGPKLVRSSDTLIRIQGITSSRRQQHPKCYLNIFNLPKPSGYGA